MEYPVIVFKKFLNVFVPLLGALIFLACPSPGSQEEDTTAPELLSITANDGRPPEVVLTFSEPVTAEIGDFTVTSDANTPHQAANTITGIAGSGTATITFTLTDDPVVGQNIKVEINTGLTDIVGNAIAATSQTVAISYIIGDTGPAGGIIFYDKGSYSLGWRYLEAATGNQGTFIQWEGSGTSVGGTSTDIGTGEANTKLIVAALGSGSYAAQICDDLGLGGYDDWFLPSKDELNELYRQKDTVGSFAYSHYWSSSEYNPTAAWAQNFGLGGVQVDDHKDAPLYLRAVRAF